VEVREKMADMEASCESSECRGGEGSLEGGGRAVMGSVVGGESLPPRKRLLAGLRQNGWLASGSNPVAVGRGIQGSSQEIGSQEEDGVVAAVDDGEGGGVVAVGVEQEGCGGCHGVESTGMRRIKHGSIFLRLCESCALLYSKRMFCPHCLGTYHDVNLLQDPVLWVLCCRCGRSVHAECENKRNPTNSSRIDAVAAYVCPDCERTSHQHQEQQALNGSLSGSRRKACSESPMRKNCSTEMTRVSASTTTAGATLGFSRSFKKPRMSRERPKLEDMDHGDLSKSEQGAQQVQDGGEAPPATVKSKSIVPVRKTSQEMPMTVSSHDAAAAAKSAAEQAAKLAMAAKENAAAKASAAVKAAAAAKLALEAAAHAAKAMAHARAELRRKAANAEPRLAESSSKLQMFVPQESTKEKMLLGRTDVKVEQEEKQAGHSGATSLDDEELARQLHRVINSSPRISHNLTPPQRKSSVKPEITASGLNNTADTARAWPRSSQTSPSEPLLQPRPQQTRPRSVIHKESKRFDSRVSRHEVKKSNMIDQSSVLRSDASEHSSPEIPPKLCEHQASEEMSTVPKTETVEGVTVSSTREDSLTTATADNSAELPFDAMVEADAGATHPVSEVEDRQPDFLQEILEAAVLGDSAMSLDEQAEANVPEEAHSSEYHGDVGQLEQHSALPDLLAEAKEDQSRSEAIALDEMSSVTGAPIPAGNAADAPVALQDVEIADVNTGLEDYRAVKMVDADGAVMASTGSAVTEVVHTDDAGIVIVDSGASEVMFADDADMVLKEAVTEVVHADDGDHAGLKDSGEAETMHTDMPTGARPVAVSEAVSETVLCGQEEVVVGSGLEKNSRQEDVAVEAGLVENITVDSQNSRLDCEGIEAVAFVDSDVLKISSDRVVAAKEDDATQVGLEETTGGGSRPDCREMQNMSLLSGPVSSCVTRTCDLQVDPEHTNGGSSETLPHASQAHEETATAWPENMLKVLPAASQALATGASMAPFTSAAQIPMQSPAFCK